MAYQDYYDWVHEAQDLYGMDYRDAQELWRTVADETGERPTFDSLYDPEYDDVDDVAEEIMEPDRDDFADWDVGDYDEVELVDGYDEFWDLEWFDPGDEIEVTAELKYGETT